MQMSHTIHKNGYPFRSGPAHKPFGMKRYSAVEEDNFGELYREAQTMIEMIRKTIDSDGRRQPAAELTMSGGK